MNATILLDTDVFSYITSGYSKATIYESHLEGHYAGISFQTVAEVYFGIHHNRIGKKRTSSILNALSQYVVIQSSKELCEEWGKVIAHRYAVGKPISAQDAWIAATAISHKLPLMTNNPTDFHSISQLNIITF